MHNVGHCRSKGIYFIQKLNKVIMTKEEILKHYGIYPGFRSTYTYEGILSAMEDYAALISAKPIVSGSLPQNVSVAEIIDVIEKLIQNSHSIGADGEPTAPILDIVDTWMKARDLLCRLRQ